MNFYTNVIEHRGKLLIRGVANGQSYLSRINYEPTLFIPTKSNTEFKTLDGKNVVDKKFGSIVKAKQFIETYKSMPEFKVYGMTRYNYQYIANEYPEDVQFDKGEIASLD